MKKYLLTAAALALFATPAAAGDSPAEGAWAIEAKTDFGTFKSDWTVAEADGAYTLEMVDQPMEGAPDGGAPPTSTISNLVVEGNHMTFDRSLDMGGQAMAMKYDLTVDGDALAGTAKMDFGEIPITGTRK